VSTDSISWSVPEGRATTTTVLVTLLVTAGAIGTWIQPRLQPVIKASTLMDTATTTIGVRHDFSQLDLHFLNEDIGASLSRSLLPGMWSLSRDAPTSLSRLFTFRAQDIIFDQIMQATLIK